MPIIASVAIGTAVTAGMNAGVTAMKGGSGEDILNSALDGASDGFMWSGIFAFGGATINAIKASGQGASLAATSNVNATKGIDIVGTNHNSLKPTQDYVYRSTVKDYVNQLNAGVKLPNIQVGSNGKGLFILDGHHRYVASKLTGKPVGITLMGGAPIGMPNWLNVFWL